MADEIAAVAAETTTTPTEGAPAAPSIISGAADTAPAQAAAPPVEGNWRDGFAGEDKDFRKRLDRFADPSALARSYREMERKLSSGELKAAPAAFPDKGTPEEQAAWRKDQGIPPDPKEYKVELPSGMVLGEADKPGVERLTAFAHKNNWTPQQLNGVLAAYYNEADAVKAQREEADATHHDQSDALLRQDWAGADYKRNLQAINNFLDTGPKEVKERLMGGRTAEGRLIANDPVMLKWLAQVALDANPAAALLPTGSQNMQGVGTRLDQLKTLVANRTSEYYKGPNAENLQAEYRNLLDVQERMKTRAA